METAAAEADAEDAGITDADLAVLEDVLADRYRRLNSLYTIVNERAEEIPFRFNPVQESLYWQLHTLNLVLKSRQPGATTFFCILELDAALFNSNTYCGIIAHTREDVERIFRDKVKKPYDKLPAAIRNRVKAVESSAHTLSFSNGSVIQVGTSLRSGTYQYLLVTEYGKLCIKFPEKAREVRTGALNTVHAGQFIAVESTAEGESGHFYDLCQAAQARDNRGEPLSLLDFKFHFYAWWQIPHNRLNPDGIVVSPEMRRYFAGLEKALGIELDDAQRAWYVKKAEQQGEDMKREHPSTPREAFEAAIEGAIFASQLARAERDGRIVPLPITSGVPVDTFWDVGIGDDMTCWFMQRNGPWHDFIGYHEANGEGWAYWRRLLDEFAVTNDVAYGRHFGPHDLANRQHDVVQPKTTKQVAAEAGIKFEDAVPAPKDKWADIQDCRSKFGLARIDPERCAQGLVRLKNYRKVWDEKRGCWKDYPHKDEHAHGADGFLVWSRGYREPKARRYDDWSEPLPAPASGTVA